VASFNRPNLSYRVLAKSKAYEQVLGFLRARPKEKRHHLLPRAKRPPKVWPSV